MIVQSIALNINNNFVIEIDVDSFFDLSVYAMTY